MTTILCQHHLITLHWLTWYEELHNTEQSADTLDFRRWGSSELVLTSGICTFFFITVVLFSGFNCCYYLFLYFSYKSSVTSLLLLWHVLLGVLELYSCFVWVIFGVQRFQIGSLSSLTVNKEETDNNLKNIWQFQRQTEWITGSIIVLLENGILKLMPSKTPYRT
jgi:hypothetical protein